MRKLFAAVVLVLGVAACDQAIEAPDSERPIEDIDPGSLGTVEQLLCPATCPPGSTFVQYAWQCTGQTTSSCPFGVEKEFAVCNYQGTYVWGTTTCRTRCGCAIPES